MILQISGRFFVEPETVEKTIYNQFSFAEDSIEFQCQYARSINTSSQMTFIPNDPIIGTGELNYIITVTGENTDGSLALGGNTNVRITPNHGFDQIAPRLANALPLFCS